MKKYDLYWAAGFLDGEGSFSLSRRKKYGLAYPVISAFQNGKELLLRLVVLFGGTICPAAKGWSWSLNGEGVRKAMKMLRPILSIKRQKQIDISLAGEVRRPEGIGSANRKKKTCPKGHRYRIYYVAAENRRKRECTKCKNERRRIRYKKDPVFRQKAILAARKQRRLKKEQS